MMKLFKYTAVVALAGSLAACGGGVKEPASLDGEKVFFAFDKSDITSESRKNLQGQALYMKNNKDVRVIVEGHCDERGTEEYNLALGARRANASKNVMVREGVEANRIRTISYGKSRPAVKGTGEEVWKWNRNTTTRVIAQ